MKSAVAAWLLIIAVAAGLRFPSLADRPMHADEAILADKFGTLLQTGSYHYDPHEFHGPLQAYLTMVPATLVGARRFSDLTESTLRVVPALCGLLLVLMPLFLVDVLGKWQAIAAAGLTAISPAMVYYSRYYIPEMLLILLTCAVLASGFRYAKTRRPAWALATGVMLGMMFVTKETAVIAVLCMLIACLFSMKTRAWFTWPAVVALGLAIAIPLIILGPADCFRALLSYSDRAIHAPLHRHPWYYFLALLGWSHEGGGPVWTEALILMLALLGAAQACSAAFRFLTIYAFAMLAVYSALPYKTPWCVLGPLHALILVAGAGAVSLIQTPNRLTRNLALALIAVCSAHLILQAWRAAFPYNCDPRNPYVYAHTGRDVLTIRDRIEALARVQPDGKASPIQVISAHNLWPLPWYLRTFSNVQWWRQLGPGYQPAGVILATPDMEQAIIHEIYEVPPPGHRELYVPLFERYVELRPQVELRAYVRPALMESLGR